MLKKGGFWKVEKSWKKSWKKVGKKLGKNWEQVGNMLGTSWKIFLKKLKKVGKKLDISVWIKQDITNALKNNKKNIEKRK